MFRKHFVCCYYNNFKKKYYIKHERITFSTNASECLIDWSRNRTVTIKYKEILVVSKQTQPNAIIHNCCNLNFT